MIMGTPYLNDIGEYIRLFIKERLSNSIISYLKRIWILKIILQIDYLFLNKGNEHNF